jgi:predicted nucleotidyltransferase
MDEEFSIPDPLSKFPMLAKDTTIYDLKRYLLMASQCKPNFMELLWMGEYLHITPAGINLLKYRQEFISKEVQKNYIGYADGQIKRMESHRKWLLNPEQKRPTPEDFGFTENYQILTKSELFAFLEFLFFSVKNKIEFLEPTEQFRKLLFEEFDFKAMFKNYPLEDEMIPKVAELTGTDEGFTRKVQKTRQYYAAVRRYENYENWKKTRNPNRALLEKTCGFDIKHSTHCLRLLYQAEHILNYGEVYVNVDDFYASEIRFLRDTQAGKKSYEEVRDESNRLFLSLKSREKEFQELGDPISEDRLSEIFIETLEIHERV